jgi:hypothetical protein
MPKFFGSAKALPSRNCRFTTRQSPFATRRSPFAAFLPVASRYSPFAAVLPFATRHSLFAVVFGSAGASPSRLIPSCVPLSENLTAIDLSDKLKSKKEEVQKDG